MKFNKWTLALAAVGAVSMASAVRADEAPKLVPLNTALSSTVISGYVDVGAQYNLGNYGPGAGVPVGTSGGVAVAGFNPINKVDNFTLNNVVLSLDKAQDESPWAAGYHVDVNLGTDAVGLSLNNLTTTGTATAAIRQGYVVLRTPLGNGIDWKIGVQDDIIGYEGNTDGANPNYTRSIGYSVEPTTLVGMIGSYKIVDGITIQGGIANATSGLATGFFGSSFPSSDKTFVGSVALTAPESWGWAKGATLSAGTLLNIDKGGQDNFYAGVTVPTPLSILKVGGSFDLVSVNNRVDGKPSTNSKNDSGWIIGAYGALTPTDKLSFNLRGEYYDLAGAFNPYGTTNGKGEEVTATVQYNLWANVISRAEFRWDHVETGGAFSNNGKNADAFLLAANLIYTF